MTPAKEEKMKQVDYLFWLKDKEDDLLAEMEVARQDLAESVDNESQELAGGFIDSVQEELLIVRGIKTIVSNYLEVDDGE